MFINSSLTKLNGYIKISSIFPLVWMTNTIPAFTLNYPNTYKLSAQSASNQPITYAITSGTLPSGLTLQPNGTISGTPTGSPGSRNVTISATSGSTTVSKTFSIATALPQAPSIARLSRIYQEGFTPDLTVGNPNDYASGLAGYRVLSLGNTYRGNQTSSLYQNDTAMCIYFEWKEPVYVSAFRNDGSWQGTIGQSVAEFYSGTEWVVASYFNPTQTPQIVTAGASRLWRTRVIQSSIVNITGFDIYYQV